LDRGRIFTGKVLAVVTYAVAAIFLAGAVGVIAGSAVSGFNPLTSLSGTRVSAASALGLIGASLLVYLLPILAIAFIGLLRSSAGIWSSCAGTSPAVEPAGRLGLHDVVQLAGRDPRLQALRQARLDRALEPGVPVLLGFPHLGDAPAAVDGAVRMDHEPRLG